MLSKPKYKTYAYVRDKYESFRARCNNATKVETGCTELDISSYKIKKKQMCLNIVSDEKKTHKQCVFIKIVL